MFNTAKLIYSLDGVVLGEYPIDKERLTIGRRASNDIQIDNLAVSGEHASILTIGQDSFLQDLNSTNGTLVNGQRINKHVLQHGDVIGFGKFQLNYVQQTTLNSTTEDFGKTMVLRAEYQQQAPAASVNTRLADAVAHSGRVLLPKSETDSIATSDLLGSIQVLNGPSMGKERLLNKALTTLGKPGTQVAVITRRPGGYFITHVEGQHYPLVNGEPIGAQAHALYDHDVIDLAGVKMEFYLHKP